MNKYRSKLEAKVSKLLGANWEYEAHKVPYVVYRDYLTDFTNDQYILEVKGYFRRGDQPKYLAIRDALEEDGGEKELIFVFSNPNKPVRKGTKLTHGGWCEKHNIRYTSVANLKSFLETIL
jgi:hypothetical protein